MLRNRADYESDIRACIGPAIPAASNGTGYTVSELLAMPCEAEWSSSNPAGWSFEIHLPDGDSAVFAMEAEHGGFGADIEPAFCGVDFRDAIFGA